MNKISKYKDQLFGNQDEETFDENILDQLKQKEEKLESIEADCLRVEALISKLEEQLKVCFINNISNNRKKG